MIDPLSTSLIKRFPLVHLFLSFLAHAKQNTVRGGEVRLDAPVQSDVQEGINDRILRREVQGGTFEVPIVGTLQSAFTCVRTGGKGKTEMRVVKEVKKIIMM